MRQFILIAALLTVACLQTRADDYKYLTAAYDNTEESYELATVQKITFEDGNVVITTSQGIVTLPEDQMQKMYFSSTATAVESLATESTGLSYSDGLLHASGKAMLYVYSSAGQLLQAASVDGEMSISLRSLPEGVYIVNMGGETIKVLRK
ncbi:MAG: T9SS type A sorting domain-containing protein [Prevotellaceae bacterium]|nr:T9SS type A sorting domain-containing protein [Prevotellaceae bacterium]